VEGREVTGKLAAAAETIEEKVRFAFLHRRSMERAYPREPAHKLAERRWAGRMERRELRALCVALRVLRVEDEDAASDE